MLEGRGGPRRDAAAALAGHANFDGGGGATTGRQTKEPGWHLMLQMDGNDSGTLMEITGDWETLEGLEGIGIVGAKISRHQELLDG